MASVINSIRNIATDPWWVPKVLFLSYLCFLIIFNFDYLMAHRENFYLLGGITFVLLIGNAAILVKRNINNETPILAGPLDFLELVIRALAFIILMLPGSVILYFIIKYIIENINIEPLGLNIILFFAVIILSPFIFIPTVLFSAKSNIFDGYRLDLLLQGGGEFMVKMLNYCLQFFFIVFLGFLVVYLGLKAILSEESSAVYMYIGLFITISFLSLFSYISDLYEESIPVVTKKNNKKHIHHKKLKR